MTPTHRAPSRAIVVTEVPGTGVVMAAIHAETLELTADPAWATVEARFATERWMRPMIEGRLVRELRVWDSWEDFYRDVGVGPDRPPGDPERDEVRGRTPIALPAPRDDDT